MSAYTSKFIQLDSWRGGQPSKHKLAHLKIKVGSAVASRGVAVVDKLDCPVLLGVDLGREFMTSVLTSYLSQNTQDSVVPVEVESVAPVQVSQVVPCRESVVPQRAADSVEIHPKVVVGGSESTVSGSSIHPKAVVGGCETGSALGSVTESVRGTRDQTRKEQLEREKDDALSSESECLPRDVDCILDFPESYFEDDPHTTTVAELCTWPEVEEVEIPLYPCLTL